MKSFLAITKALSDANRIRALMGLNGGELCVCQLIELLDLAPSTVSKHMSILLGASLVETRKSGKWIYYSIANDSEDKHIKMALEFAKNSLGNAKQIIDDKNRLKQIRKMSRDTLCNHYKK